MLLPIGTALSGFDRRLRYMLQNGTVVVGSLLLWPLWEFMVLPRLKPNEPKRLPNWIPCELQHQRSTCC